MIPFFKTADKAPVTLEVIQAIGVILNALFDEPLIVKKEDPPKEKAMRFPSRLRCPEKSGGKRCALCLGHTGEVHRNGHLLWPTNKKKVVAKKSRPAKRRSKASLGPQCRSFSILGYRCERHGSHAGDHRDMTGHGWHPHQRVSKKPARPKPKPKSPSRKSKSK